MLSAGDPGNRTLGARLASRDNNFDALRLLAAFAVIVSHAFTIRDGDSLREPLRKLSGYCTMGETSVAIFFIISGLLVARSFLADPKAWSYLRKRLLRILPGLVVCVAACIFIVGPLFTILPLGEYFHDRTVLKFAKNALLLPGRFDLPGVFLLPDVDPNAPQSVVNGSLWSLPMEFMMYLGVLALGMARLLRRKWCVILMAAALLFQWLVMERVMQRPDFVPGTLIYKYRTWLSEMPHLAFYFFGGTLMLLFKDSIVIDWRLGVAAVAIVAASWHTSHGYFLFSLCLPYIVMWVAFARVGFLKPVLQSVTKWGDFSYGVYLYGYPVEQIIFHTCGKRLGFPAVIGLSCVATLIPAIASWYLVEKPFMKLKKASTRPEAQGGPTGDPAKPPAEDERSIRPPMAMQRQYSVMRQVIFFV